MVATSTAADTLDAGEGTDVLGLTADVTATVGAQFSNFEILKERQFCSVEKVYGSAQHKSGYV